jgi:hypothetical protein
MCKKKAPEDPEILADIYKTANEYDLKELCSHIENQVERFKDSYRFIVGMMRIALEQNNEDLIKRLIPIFKTNKALHQSSEFRILLSQYAMQLAEYLLKQ